MKPIFTTLLLVCTSTIALSQEHKATFGKYTGCLRTGGICTIESPPVSDNKTTVVNNNISFITIKEGATILRVYRDQLSQEELDQILGTPITSENKSSLQFIMEEALPLPEDIIALTSKTKSKQLTALEAKTYPTVITDNYIDITIVRADTNVNSKDE
ncbi:hypothetical protein GCM10011344_42350 [Dokdonia pacifica]|uniref:Uncharacterized protein n=1 Tax=Dokdonia pacifica TaxID=1627892 RepID=A0A239DLL4_9FLAO|nr:hypothetical protein [Dokdonia pacifica]GGG37018.1 hypothetical protein GCM10011344_42350 [Dokdonia pacifica]SNS33327.1 hypothetical protein SAMN06265376_11184 [Dokdonia pacifica]